MPPTALRMLRAAAIRGAASRSTCAPSAPPARLWARETYDWGRAALGLTINEFYGQTECNQVLARVPSIGVSKPGAIGKPVPVTGSW